MQAEAAAARSVCLAVPGALDTVTGGYLYDRRILEELGKQSWLPSVLALDASFPTPTAAALAAARAGFDGIADGGLVVIDGLVLAGLLPILPLIVDRLETVALIHHPLADETGIDAGLAAVLESAERAALALVPRIIVTSPWTRRRLGDYGVAPERVAVVEPGVDRGPPSTRKPASTLRLLTVATVTARKGHSVLIEALAQLQHLDWSLCCVGSLDLDPQCAEALRSQIARAGLADRVSLLGELGPDRVRARYLDADLFVLPSYLEGYGMALAEALAHGLPIVSTTAGAIPDTVPVGAARLVPPGNAAALAEVLSELMLAPVARRRLAVAARAAAAAVPTWAQAARRFAAALDRPDAQ